MLELSKVRKFYDSFSLVTVADDKVPNFKWRDGMTEKITWEKFSKQYDCKGYSFKSDDGQDVFIKATTNFGIICGYDYLEVMDVDLKVFSTAQEQREFWDEYLGHLKDNILDFDDKFVIYKTKNAGYHILYKTKRVEGSQKVARLAGHKECVLETRGLGGYVFAYPENKVSKKDYHQIDFISDSDREILFSFSRYYNAVEEAPKEPKKQNTEFKGGDLSPWQDYNEKVSIWDIIGDDFTIPRGGDKSKFTLIRRHNATSAHSGSVFKDSGCMYLFSTGCAPFNEKVLYTPFLAYSAKFHNNDHSAAAKQLYADGYGSRVKKLIEQKSKSLPDNTQEIEAYKYNQADLTFPIDIFPAPIQSYIMDCATKLDSKVDYMGCALLWLISVCIGNSIHIKVRNGWIETCTLWISLVGKAGAAKTPSINNMIRPLMSINNREVSRYLTKLAEYNEYEALPAKEKKDHSPVKRPTKTQFIANDITVEALVDLHQDCKNAVGIFKDEIAGWLKDMNKYKPGSDLEFWLSGWSGTPIALNRITRPGSFVAHPFMPVMGGIQPDIFSSFYTEENKSNGFMDRMLLAYPDVTIAYYNENELDPDVITWYRDTIISFFDILQGLKQEDMNGEVIPLIAEFSPEAKNEWKRIFNEMTDVQNSDDENEYLKSMYPKQKSYIPRFALLIHVFEEFLGKRGKTLEISKDAILKAERLSKYFIATAKKVKIDQEVGSVMKSMASGSKEESVMSMYNANPDFNRSQAAEILGISRKTIQRIISQSNEKKMSQ